MIRSLLTFLFKRDGESAACLAIDIAQHMGPKYLRQIAEYMLGLAADLEVKANDAT